MAKYDHLPIYRQALELTVFLEKTVRNFSRYQKYSIGERLRQTSWDVITLVVKANNTPVAERWPLLVGLRDRIEEVSIALTVAKELEAFANHIGNVYLNTLDQFVKHELKVRHYVRYVDDAILLHEDRAVLEEWKAAIETFLADRLLLRLNEGATRLKPVSCGINFLGYIVHPDHRLTRRRVAGSFLTRLDEFRQHLVRSDCGTGVVTYRFDEQIQEGLLATLNSYMAHIAKASSHRLLTSILDEHLWLSAYFDINGGKATRTWKPPRSFRRLEDQWSWFRRSWPDAAIFFQVGAYFELYGSDALWANEILGLRPQEPRFGSVHRVGIPARLVGACVRKTLVASRPVMLVAETGYPLYCLKERLPVCLTLPDPSLSA